MRNKLRAVCDIDVNDAGVLKNPPSHLGLAYNAWAPTGADGKVPETAREKWLATLAGLKISSDYKHAFARWKSGLEADPSCILMDFTLESRLLIGHGNPSATEVGLTVHHTWGVPIIPGSALKGLCAHYTVSTFGPDDLKKAPWEQAENDKERAAFQGVVWDGSKIKAGPGRYYRALFGAPDAQLDKAGPKDETRAISGEVTFHDALYVPGSAAENKNHNPNDDVPDQPFVEDVLTVHQKTYYNTQGKPEAGKPEPWPNDYDSPNPVAFLTVKRGARFLIALSGPEEATVLAVHILREALHDWGVGGKTSLGYGRGKITEIKAWGSTLK